MLLQLPVASRRAVVPYRIALSCCVVLYRAVSWPVRSCHIVSHRVVSFCIVLRRIVLLLCRGLCLRHCLKLPELHAFQKNIGVGGDTDNISIRSERVEVMMTIGESMLKNQALVRRLHPPISDLHSGGHPADAAKEVPVEEDL